MTQPTAEDIDAELANAYEALDDAESDLSQGRLKSATNRAYVAMFHAARAVLWMKGHAPKTHRGLQHLFRDHLEKPRLVTNLDTSTLTHAFEERQLADYHDVSASLDRKEVKQLVADASQFVDRMDALIKDLREK